jgi:DNA replication licensing factor MCM4
MNGTPRRVAPSSSPMMYRSSPADIARSYRERDVSSPLRQMTNSQPTQDGERTPRASGLLGGNSAARVSLNLANPP